jgi:hypothetical protein
MPAGSPSRRSRTAQRWRIRALVTRRDAASYGRSWQGSYQPGSGRPPPKCHCRPDSLYDAKGPCALEETVDRAQRARGRKSEDEPGTSVLEGVANEHRRDGEEAEGGQSVQRALPPLLLPLRGQDWGILLRRRAVAAIERILSWRTGERPAPDQAARGKFSLTPSIPQRLIFA